MLRYLSPQMLYDNMPKLSALTLHKPRGEDSSYRYQRSREVVEILKQAWTLDEINHHGEVYQFEGLTTDPVKPYQQNGGPLLYFGGYSPDAVDLCRYPRALAL